MIYFSLPGGMELVVIVIVILVLFGGKKIPEMMRGLGSGIREFKKAQSDISDEINKAIKEEPEATKDKKDKN
jgi:sec-independent protein translocase protein TatA